MFCVEIIDSLGKLIIAILLMVTSMLLPFLMGLILIAIIIYSLEWNHSTEKKVQSPKASEGNSDINEETVFDPTLQRAGNYQLFAAFLINFICIAPLHVESIITSHQLATQSQGASYNQLKSLLTALFYFKSVSYPLLYRLCMVVHVDGVAKVKRALKVPEQFEQCEHMICDVQA